MLRRRVTPTFVVALDPTITNAGHFQGLDGIEDVWLVGEGSLAPGVFQQFAGRTFAFEVSGHQPWKWLERAEFFRGRLRAWGSVLTSAYDLAVMLGCDPIIFIGADLAFSGSQPYSRGTTYEEAWAGSIVGGIDLPSRWTYDLAKRPLVPEPDVRGNNVATTSILRTFRDWILADLRQGRGGRVLNATGAGILHGQGMTQVSASEIGDLGTRASPDEIVESVRAAYRPDPDAWRRVRALASDVLEHGDIAEGAPLTAWDEFVLGSVDREILNQVLRDAVDGLGDAPPERPAPEATVVAAELLERALRSPLFDGLFHPERIALIAASLAGVPAPGWVAPPPFASEAADRVRWLSLAAMGLLVLQHEHDALASAGLPESPPAMGVEGTPASAIADWRPGPRRLVWAIEMMIAQVLRSSPPPTSLTDWLIASTFPIADEGTVSRAISSEDLARTREAFARVQLLRELLLAVTATGGDDGLCVRATGVCAVIARALAAHLEGRSAEVADATAGITIAPGGSQLGATVRMDVQSRDLARALTGWSVRWPLEESPEPRLQWQAPFGDSMAMVALEPSAGDPALPRDVLFARDGSLHDARLISPDGVLFNHVASLDASSAIATGFGAAASFRVEEDGRVTQEPAWPHLIDAEVPFREGRLAWTGTLVRPHERESTVQWRGRDGDASSTTVPFMSLHTLVTSPDAVYWPAITGGLWRWSPEQGAEQVLAGQPLVNAVREKSAVRLETIDPSAGRVRPGGQHSLRLLEDGRVEPGPRSLLGVIWSRAECRGMTADAYAFADVVIVTNAMGGDLALVAYYPVGVAWAGRSLLVLSATGHLLLFEGLGSR